MLDITITILKYSFISYIINSNLETFKFMQQLATVHSLFTFN